MKKEYMIPVVEVEEFQSDVILCSGEKDWGDENELPFLPFDG